MFNRSDNDVLLDFHSQNKHKPKSFYRASLFNDDTYVKSAEDTDNDYPIADIWIRLEINIIAHTR